MRRCGGFEELYAPGQGEGISGGVAYHLVVGHLECEFAVTVTVLHDVASLPLGSS